MRFLPHPTDPERFYYDTMTLLLPADDPDYCPPAWMGLPEGTDGWVLWDYPLERVTPLEPQP